MRMRRSFWSNVSTVGRQRAEGLDSLSARERAEGCTGNDRGPMESTAASGLLVTKKLGERQGQ